MQSLGTAAFAGLCLLATCAYAQPVDSRGQYSVSFKIVSGKLAVDRDAFHVAPSLVKFEAEIQRSVRQAIARTVPLTLSLRADSSWANYVNAYENWSAADLSRLDLGTLFSGDFLFADMLKQTPDSGLVLNEDEIDPANGTISFSILPLFDSKTVRIDLPAMIESRQRARTHALRKRLQPLNGSLWSSVAIRLALSPVYANLGLTPQILVLPRSGTIQIVEGPRIASIVLPPDQVPARDIDRVMWELLDTRHLRIAMRTKKVWAPSRAVDFHRDLGYPEGDEPYVTPYQLQALQLLLSPLGYTLTTQASTRTGPSQYVDLRVQSASTGKGKRTRRIAGGFEYKPGQGFSALGNGQLPSLTLSGGGPSGNLGSGDYAFDFLDFERARTHFRQPERIHVRRAQPLPRGRKSGRTPDRRARDSRVAALAWPGRKLSVGSSGREPCLGLEPEPKHDRLWRPARTQPLGLRTPFAHAHRAPRCD
jgi:hypothetical protein